MVSRVLYGQEEKQQNDKNDNKNGHREGGQSLIFNK